MDKKIKTVGLFGKYQDQTVAEHILRLEEFLLGRKLKILFDQATAEHIAGAKSPARPREAITHRRPRHSRR